ncbi:hypothetical protein [Flavobacterium sp. Root186]|uniref:hypothetical protein n=1 Tax=Flavobacterium sp. Root186 TaxID=1736485 RepID=UPI0006FC6C76|nr:hypothetical protein [Flavobacterium sp. Root186]KRB54162.1 hypothetical protein ASD98_17960 [Flavobacterium sp. Root186]
MKKFIIKSILFLIPVLLFTIFLENLIRSVPNDYSIKKEYLDKNSAKIEVLILGSSHTYFGIDPKYITAKTFNSAYISQSVDYDFEILKKYKTRFKQLKYIVIPIDYFSLYSRLEEGTEKWRIKNYNVYYNVNSSGPFKLSNHFELLNGKVSDNIMRVNLHYKEHKNDNITCNGSGWGTIYKSENSINLTETGKAAAKRHTINIQDNIYYKENIKTIKSIIQLAEEINVKVIFITSPAYKTYTANLEPNQLKGTIGFMNKTSKDNRNVMYYNLLEDKSFIDKDFYDADHLNEIGAKKLSLKINNIINYKTNKVLE